ncbi:MAG: outer membrane protein assembly factor BamE [Alphaproteobacteria bacterium]
MLHKPFFIFLLLLITACTPIIKQEGQLLSEEDVTSIVPYVHRTKDVQELLGSPSTTSQFTNNGKKWYYVGQKMKHNFFSMPEPVDRQVVVITFDKNNIVQNIDKFGIEKGQEVDMVSEITPTLGKEPGFIEDLFGNMGSFGPKMRELEE